MNNKTHLMQIATAAIGLFALQSATLAGPPPGKWSAEPTFADDFNGTELDKTKWSTGYRWADVINSEMQGFVPENVTIADGFCTIKAEKRAVQNTDWVGFKGAKQNYASGAIQTYDKWAQSYGYFEVRAKMPGGKGTWPAFWLLPDRGNAVTNLDQRVWVGGNAKGTPVTMGNEIDIFEIMGSWQDPKSGAGKSHSGYIWGYDGKSGWGEYARVKNGIGPETYLVPNQSSEFHTYGVAWGPGQLDYYIDDIKVLSREEPPTMTKIGSAPGYIILNVALKTDDWTPNKISVADMDTDLPRTMVIDYVKVWSGTPNPSPPPVAEGTYRLTPSGDATKCLQVADTSMDNGIKVNQATYKGGANQQWTLHYLGGAVYEIKARHSDKSLHTVGGSGADFTNAEQFTDDDSAGQRWKFEASGDTGYFRLTPLTNAKAALSVWAKDENGKAYIFFYFNDAGQKWKFEPVN